MKHIRRVVALMLVAASILMLCACGKEEQKTQVDPQAAFQALRTQVKYDTEIADVGESGAIYFPELPQGSKVQMYAGSGYYADKLVLITLADEKDADVAMKSVQAHVSQLRTQFQSYIPEEVPKIDHAVIWQQGNAVILCITPDYEKAQSVLDNAASLEAVPTEPASESLSPTVPEDTTQEATEPVLPTTEPPTEPEPYPTITSKSGTYEFHDVIYQVDNTAFEGFVYSESAARDYAAVVNKIAENLKGEVNVYALTIPTAIGIVFPDDIKPIIKKYEDQGEAISSLFSMFSENVIPVNCYDNLMRHRDEYLYFKTDHHWTARGAYYAYESFCKVKGVAPYSLEQREMVEFPGFKGSLYGKLKRTEEVTDTVHAYYPVNRDATMTFTDSKGNTSGWPIINDVSNYSASAKYGTFAAGDNPYAEFHNPGVKDGSVCIVIKESFGCALMPFIVDHYSTVYEIDYRYWDGSLTDFAKKVGADDMIFANNTMRLFSGLVAGDLNRIA